MNTINSQAEKTLFRIKKLRNKRGIKQCVMAEMLEICQSAYTKIENGQQKLDLISLIKIAFALDTTVAYLVGEKKKDKKKSVFI